MSHVRQHPAAFASSGHTLTVTLSADVPAGSTLVAGVMLTAGSQLVDAAGSDDSGNAWRRDVVKGITGQNMTVAQLTCEVTTDLDAGDHVVFTTAGTITRGIAIVQEFDDPTFGTTGTKSGDNGGTSNANPTTGAFTPTSADSLLIGCVGLVSPGRVYTAGAGWTAGAQQSTSVGSADRGLVMQWRYLTPASSVSSNGTFNSGSIYGAAAHALDLTDPTPPPAGATANVWNGTDYDTGAVKVWNGTDYDTDVEVDVST